MLCVDERRQIQVLDRPCPVLPMRPGMPERCTSDSTRNGIIRPFGAFNIADGAVVSELHRQHRATEFKKVLTTIDKVAGSRPDQPCLGGSAGVLCRTRRLACRYGRLG